MSNQSNPNNIAAGTTKQAQPQPQSNNEPNEHPILDENPKPKLRRISARCDEFGELYHAATADVNFVFDVDGNEELVPAHKCVLALHSSVFRQMFYGELKESGDIKLTDTTIDAFVDFITCIYNALYIDGQSQTKMSKLVYLAHKYDVDWLEKECQEILCKVIDRNFEPVFWIIQMTTLYSYNELHQKCIDQIRVHGDLLVDSPKFVDCGKEVMKTILGVDFIDRNEVKVFEACIDWAKQMCKKAELDPETPRNIRTQLGNCFELIRFNSMTAQQFVQCLSINSNLFSHDEIQQIANELTGTISSERQRKSSSVHKFSFMCFIFTSFYKDNGALLQTLFEDKTTTDVTFVFKNEQNEETERLSAHKCILARSSSVFENQFENSNISNEEINITDASADAFKDFLRLIYLFYSPEFIADQHIDAILSMAKTYEVKHIIDFYPDHLIHTLNGQNVNLWFELSRKHSLDSLETKCVDFMKENGAQVIASDAFLGCSQPIFKSILELGICNDGNSLIDACMKWAKKYCDKNRLDSANPKNLRTAFGDAFELIPFSSMGPLEFIDFLRYYGDMFTGDAIKKVLNEIADRKNVKPVAEF